MVVGAPGISYPCYRPWGGGVAVNYVRGETSSKDTLDLADTVTVEGWSPSHNKDKLSARGRTGIPGIVSYCGLEYLSDTHLASGFNTSLI